MAIPLPLRKLTASFEFQNTTHYLVAYQPTENGKIYCLKRASECEELRDLQPRENLHIRVGT